MALPKKCKFPAVPLIKRSKTFLEARQKSLFFLQSVPEQNPQIIPPAVEDAVNINIVPKSMIKNQILSADEKALIQIKFMIQRSYGRKQC